MYVAGRMLFAFVIALVSLSAMSLQRDDQSANDTEIRIGNLMPYTGPLAEFSAIGKAEAAYFDMINDRGGINGRKVRFISYDDNSDPTVALDLTRGLVERDNVLLMLGSFGTAGNLAVRSFLNERKIPQLFVASGAEELGDPKAFPWTMAGNRRFVPRGASTPTTSRPSIRNARSWRFGKTTSLGGTSSWEFRKDSAI
jgi:branched-chain amino acid transport system substrate-binding protein